MQNKADPRKIADVPLNYVDSRRPEVCARADYVLVHFHLFQYAECIAVARKNNAIVSIDLVNSVIISMNLDPMATLLKVMHHALVLIN